MREVYLTWNHLCCYVRRRFTSPILPLQSHRGVFGSFDSEVRQANTPAAVGVGEKKTQPIGLCLFVLSRITAVLSDSRTTRLPNCNRLSVFPLVHQRENCAHTKTLRKPDPHPVYATNVVHERPYFCIFVETHYPERASSLWGPNSISTDPSRFVAQS